MFLPFAALFATWDLLEVKLGSEISLIKLILGFVRLKFVFPFPHGISPWLQGLFLFGKVVVVPLLWGLALYLGFLKLRGGGLGGGVRTFLARLPFLFSAYVLLILRVFLGFLLLVVPGITWGLSWIFGPLIVLAGDPYRDPFSASESITQGRRWRLFVLFLGLAILDEIGRFGTINIAFYNLSAAAAFKASYGLFLHGLALGAVLAAFVELSRRDVGHPHGLPVVSIGKVVWDRPQLAWSFPFGMALLGVIGYLAWSVAPLWNPLGPAPPLDVPELPPISQRAELILGTERLEAIAPGPREGEIIVVTPSGLAIRTVPDLALVRFVPVDRPPFTYAVALSPSGQEAVLTGYEFTLLVRLSDGGIVWRRDGLTGDAVAFSPKGDVVAVGHRNKVTLLDPRTGEELFTMVEKAPFWVSDSVINRWSGWPFTEDMEVKHLSFDPEGDLLVISAYNSDGHEFYYAVLRIPSGEVIRRGLGFGIFSPKGELVLVQNNLLFTLDPLTGKSDFSVHLLPKERSIVVVTGAWAAVSADGRRFTVCKGGDLYLVDRTRGRVSVHTFPVVERRVPQHIHLGSLKVFLPWIENTQVKWCVGLSQAPVFVGNHILFVNCHRLCVFELQRGRYVKTPLFSDYSWGEPVRPVSISPNEDVLALVPSGAYGINLYSLPEGIAEKAVFIEKALGIPFPVVEFSPEGDALALGIMNVDRVEVRSPDRWQPRVAAEGLRGPLGWWRRKVLVVKDFHLGFLDPETGLVQTTSLTLRVDSDAGWDLENDVLVVFDRGTGEILVVNVAAKAELFSAHLPDLTCAALSPAGELLALGFRDGRVEVKELGKQKGAFKATLAIGDVEALEFISSALLACGGKDRLAVLDLRSGETVFEDHFHGHWVFQIEAVGPYLGVVLRSGPVLVYRLPLR